MPNILTRAQCYIAIKHTYRLLDAAPANRRVRLLRQLHQLQSQLPLLS